MKCEAGVSNGKKNIKNKLLEYIKINDPLYYKIRYSKIKKKFFIDTTYYKQT